MSLFNKWWDAANAKDRVRMAELLDDGFIFARHNTGEEWRKDQFLDAMMTDVRDKTASEGRRLIYENDEIIVSHSILDGPTGRNACCSHFCARHPALDNVVPPVRVN